MADQTVKIEDKESKYRVAFDMALLIMTNSENYPRYDNKDEFLDLVTECVQALNSRASRSSSKG